LFFSLSLSCSLSLSPRTYSSMFEQVRQTSGITFGCVERDC
jgi:hypothetical protein